MDENQLPAEEERVESNPRESYTVPWSVTDTWIGVGLLVMLSVGLVSLAAFGNAVQLFQSVGLILAEGMYLVPVIVILAWRRANWKELGFRAFDAATMGLGCGLLLAGYAFIIIHNLLLYVLGVNTQGEQIFELFSQLESPFWFFFAVVLVAPLVEEIFFRGFLLQGFRQRYGAMPAILLSSFIFAVAHVDPVAFIPTFLLGAVMAYVYHRSNSLFPGMILHFLVNGFGACMAYIATQLPGVIPT